MTALILMHPRVDDPAIATWDRKGSLGIDIGSGCKLSF